MPSACLLSAHSSLPHASRRAWPRSTHCNSLRLSRSLEKERESLVGRERELENHIPTAARCAALTGVRPQVPCLQRPGSLPDSRLARWTSAAQLVSTTLAALAPRWASIQALQKKTAFHTNEYRGCIASIAGLFIRCSYSRVVIGCGQSWSMSKTRPAVGRTHRPPRASASSCSASACSPIGQQ